MMNAASPFCICPNTSGSWLFDSDLLANPSVASSLRIPSAWTVLSSTVTLVLVSLTSVPPSEDRMVLKPTT